MKILNEYVTSESTETHRGDPSLPVDHHSTLVVPTLSFGWTTDSPDPESTVRPLAQETAMEATADSAGDPDWADTSLRSGAWDFWGGEEEDGYSSEDGEVL
jgi:hypothetical protein